MSLYAEVQMTNHPDLSRAQEYLRKNRKYLSIKNHTDAALFANEERLCLNGLVLLAEEEVDKVILAHYEARFGCGTRALYHHLREIDCFTVIYLMITLCASGQIYHKISEVRIDKVVKASSTRGQIHPVFSNKGPKRIIQSKRIFERLQVDFVDLSSRPAFDNGVEFRYVLVIVDIFSRYLFLRPLTSKSSGKNTVINCNS